jgi:hypothetical protein
MRRRVKPRAPAWARSEKIAVVSVVVTFLGVLVAARILPDVQVFLHKKQQPSKPPSIQAPSDSPPGVQVKSPISVISRPISPPKTAYMVTIVHGRGIGAANLELDGKSASAFLQSEKSANVSAFKLTEGAHRIRVVDGGAHCVQFFHVPEDDNVILTCDVSTKGENP